MIIRPFNSIKEQNLLPLTLLKSSSNEVQKTQTAAIEALKTDKPFPKKILVKRFFIALTYPLVWIVKKIIALFKYIFCKKHKIEKTQLDYIENNIKTLETAIKTFQFPPTGDDSFATLSTLLLYDNLITEQERSLKHLDQKICAEITPKSKMNPKDTLLLKQLELAKKKHFDTKQNFESLLKNNGQQITTSFAHTTKQMSSSSEIDLYFIEVYRRIIEFLSVHIKDIDPAPPTPIPADPSSGIFTLTKQLKMACKIAQKLLQHATERTIKNIPTKIPVGIQNIGNSCYQNSACQALFNTPHLVKKLFEFNPKLPTPPIYDKNENPEQTRVKAQNYLDKVVEYGNNKRLREALKTLFLNYNQPNNADLIRLSAQAIRTALFDTEMMFGDQNEQQDASQCLTSFLNSFGFTMKSEKVTTSKDGIHESSSRLEDQQKYELQIEKDKPNNLIDLLKSYQKEEINDSTNQWTGPSNQNHTAYERTISLTTVPETVIISLNRYDNRLNKINADVNAPDIIDLKDMMTPNALENTTSTRFRLRSYVQHGGSYHGGHYTANVLKEKDGQNVWHYTSDSHLREINKTNKKSAETVEGDHRKKAYIFFYERISE